MTPRMRKISRLIAEGLASSAQAVATHEGLPWDPDDVRPPRRARRAHNGALFSVEQAPAAAPAQRWEAATGDPPRRRRIQ